MLSSAAYGNGILHSEQKILAEIYVSIICTHMVTHMVDFCRPSHISCIANAMVKYRIAGFCHEDFNVVPHRIHNIKIRYIFYLVIFYHVRFCNCLVLCLYFSISLRSKWGLFQTLKEHYLMHKSIQNSTFSAISI